MKIEEKISRILENEETCSYRIEKAIAIASNPEAPLSGDMAEWMRQIGIDDPRIEPALDETLSAEAREAMFRRLMDRYCLNNPGNGVSFGLCGSDNRVVPNRPAIDSDPPPDAVASDHRRD